MASKKKSPASILSDADTKHKRVLEAYAKKVDKLYKEAVKDISQLAVKVGSIPKADQFSFSKNPGIETEVDSVISKLSSRIQAVIESGDRSEWTAACRKSDAFLSSIMNTSTLPKVVLKSYQDRNLEALAAFQDRQINGMGLSDRVWNYVSNLKQEVETIVDTTKMYRQNGIDSQQSLEKIQSAIGTGMSADELSREIRSCLKEPNKLFRRVRDKYGNLHLSKNAQLYHPGQGVYRSSYKNAMRMTRSEINMAYRQSDYLRWQQLDFVVGMKVQLSGNHTCLGKDGKAHIFTDICDILAGDYPKDFKFTGWHPQCRCIATPIMKPYDEWNEDRKHLDSKGYRSLPASNEVNNAPAAFSAYIRANEKRIAGWKSTPYYIKDNPHYIDRAVNPGKYPAAKLELATDRRKLLEDYRMYAYNHQSSAKFAQALDDALKAMLAGDQKSFDAAMTSMDFVKKTNERVQEYTALKKAKEDLYLVLNAHPDYKDVKYDSKTGGIKATHKNHNFDPNTGQYEKDVRDGGYNSGHVVILESEKGTIIGKRYTEGTWDGQEFELMGCETATPNNLLAGLKHSSSKGTTKIAALTFPKGGFEAEAVERAIKRYAGLVKQKPEDFIEFERVVCIQNGKVVYDRPYKTVREAPVSWYAPRTAKVDDITRMTKKLAAEINLDASKLRLLKTKAAKKPIDPAQERHKYDAQIEELKKNAARYKLDMSKIDEAYTSLDMAKIEAAIKEQEALLEKGKERMGKILAAADKRHAKEAAKLEKMGLTRKEYAEKILAERRAGFDYIQKKTAGIVPQAKEYTKDIDLTRLKDLQKRGQYNQMAKENAAIEAKLAEIKVADTQMADLIPDIAKFHKDYTLEEMQSAYGSIQDMIKSTGTMTIREKETFFQNIVNTTGNQMVKNGIGAQLAIVKVDIKIIDLTPGITDIVGASQKTGVGIFKDLASKAQSALKSRDVAQAEALLNQAKAMRPIVDQYDALVATGYKTSNKFNKAMNDCLQALNAGDVAQANKCVMEAAQIKATNDANVARRKAREEAARKDAEEAAKKRAEEEAASAKKKKLSEAENIDDIREALGVKTPVLLQNYEKSVARHQYTRQEYLDDQEAFRDKMKAMFDESNFSHCFRPDRLDGYLDKGILTNLQSPKGDYNGRRAYGHFAYGFQDNQKDVPRNKWLKDGDYYRCGVPVSKDPTIAYSQVSGYGACQIVLRKDKLVTTFTFGNSLGEQTIPSLTCDPKVCSLDNGIMKHFKDAKYSNRTIHEGKLGLYSTSYIELQYLPMGDSQYIGPEYFQSITLPRHPVGYMGKDKDFWEKWADKGIDVMYNNSKTGKVEIYLKGRGAIPAKHNETAAERKARQAKANARAQERHELRDRKLKKEGLTAETKAQALLAQRAEEIARFMNESQAVIANKSNLINADFGKEQFKTLENLVKSGNARAAKAEVQRIEKALAAQKAELEKLKDLIPDYERWHKDFTIEDLQEAHDAIQKQMAWMENNYQKRNDPNEVIDKWKRVADNVENPYNGSQRHKTWEVAQTAYLRKRDELIYQYRKDSIDENIAALKAFKTKDKDFMNAFKEASNFAKEGKWGNVEEWIEKAKKRMLELAPPPGEKILKLGESAQLLFKSEDFAQARKDAAKWFKCGDKATSAQMKKAFKAADDYMSQYAEEMWKTLTLEEKQILWLYTDGSQYINQEMLGTYALHMKSWIDGSMRNGLADANVLTSILEKAPALRDDMWIQSGKSEAAFNAIFGINIRRADLSSLVGREGTNELFMSCHTARDGAFTKGASTGDANNVVLSIFMPKGTKGAYVEPFASWGDSRRGAEGYKWDGKKRKDAPSDQVEFLLQRGAKFRITKAEWDPVNRKWYVDVDLIEQTAVGALNTNIKGLENRRVRYKAPAS